MAKRPKHTKNKKKAAPKAVKKIVKRAAKKAAAKRPLKKPAAKPAKAPARKAPRMVVVVVPQHITLDLPPVLHDRLKALSMMMDMPMEAVMRQALTEFADTWEDHHRTVAALADTSDRMQVVVKDE